MQTLRQRHKPLLLGMLLASITPVTAQMTLLHPVYDNTPGHNLGWGVAVEGKLGVAGAPSDYSPRAIVFDTTTGAVKHTLTSPSPLLGGGFGRSVAISGTRIVAGAFMDNSGATYSGSVFVYDVASPTPTTPLMMLTNPSPETGDYFGFTVAISGNRIAVGAINDNTGAHNAGSVYVYDLARPIGAPPIVTLTNPSPAMAEEFGNGVAIHDTLVVVGGYNDDNAYVFDLASATPSAPVFTLRNPGAGFTDYFGSTVAISGSRVVIGAYCDDTAMSDAGIAYIYDLASPVPTVPVITLTNPSPATRSFFGYSVSISGSRAVVGRLAPPRAYVYELAGATPTIPVATLISPPAAENFGFAVAVDGTTTVVGAPYDSTKWRSAGGAYVFGPSPALAISHPAPGLAKIAWTPPTSSGFVLQYRDGFGPRTWLNAPSGPTNPISVPATNTSRFYRLYRP